MCTALFGDAVALPNFSLNPRGVLKTTRRDTRARLAGTLSRSETAAYFDPMTQVITLNSVEKPAFKAVGQAPLRDQHNLAALIAHEFTHWGDYVATLWGQRFLLQWYNGMAAWERQ